MRRNQRLGKLNAKKPLKYFTYLHFSNEKESLLLNKSISNLLSLPQNNYFLVFHYTTFPPNLLKSVHDVKSCL